MTGDILYAALFPYIACAGVLDLTQGDKQDLYCSEAIQNMPSRQMMEQMHAEMIMDFVRKRHFAGTYMLGGA